MLDITLFRTDQGGNPDLVRESQRRRYADVSLVDKVIEHDSEWRKSVPRRTREKERARSATCRALVRGPPTRHARVRSARGPRPRQ